MLAPARALVASMRRRNEMLVLTLAEEAVAARLARMNAEGTDHDDEARETDGQGKAEAAC